MYLAKGCVFSEHPLVAFSTSRTPLQMVIRTRYTYNKRYVATSSIVPDLSRTIRYNKSISAAAHGHPRSTEQHHPDRILRHHIPRDAHRAATALPMLLLLALCAARAIHLTHPTSS